MARSTARVYTRNGVTITSPRVYTSEDGIYARAFRRETPSDMTAAACAANEQNWTALARRLNPAADSKQLERAAELLKRARMIEVRKGIPAADSKILRHAAEAGAV